MRGALPELSRTTAHALKLTGCSGVAEMAVDDFPSQWRIVALQ